MVPSARLHILLDYRPALRQRTGVGEYVHHLADALRRHRPDDRITLFSSSWKDRLADGIQGAGRIDLRIPVRLLNFAWHRMEWPPVERLGARPDIAWSLHPLLIPSRHAAQVVTVYDLYFLDHPSATTGEIRRDYPALARAHAQRADGIVTISDYTRGLTAERFGVPLEKIVVCHPGAPPWKRRTASSTRGPILHVGTIEPRKNVRALIRAYAALVARLPDAPPLVFAGRCVERPEKLLGDYATALRTRVSFRGYVSDDDRRRLYAEASMLVIPSADEGFGMPAVEAMTVGVPVVAADRGALPEVVGDAGLLVDADDQEAFANAMARVLDAPNLCAQLAEAGVRRAERFNWDASAARLADFFQAIAAARTERR